MRRNFVLSARHDKLLVRFTEKLNVTMTETLQRALEALEEKEAARDREVGKP